MNNQTPTIQLVKTTQKNETVRVSNVIKHNGEFTKSPRETLNYLLDILSPSSQQTEKNATRSDLVENPFMRHEVSKYFLSISTIEHTKKKKKRNLVSSAAFTKSPYLRICAKKYGYAYKKYAYTYKILTLVGLLYIAFYQTCVYTLECINPPSYSKIMFYLVLKCCIWARKKPFKIF